MHEMALAENVLQLIEEAGQTQGFRRVRTVILEIGQLAAVEVEALRFCFDAVTTGTLAAGAHLQLIETPGLAWCRACAASVTIAEPLACCPNCGTYALEITGGTQMRVKELEVE
jgi:hydrogenase nickel incorporation protein HypA/HybF